MAKETWLWRSDVEEKDKDILKKVISDKSSKEGAREKLPKIVRSNEQILEKLAKDMQNEIVEKESLKKMGYQENSVQKLNNLKKDLELHKKMVETEDVKKEIEKLESEIKDTIKSN